MPPKVLLVILDGFGLRDTEDGNAVKLASAPVLQRFSFHRSRTRLEASGEAVGLPAGQMGNSEVGHMNLGAGRVVWQLQVRIDHAIEDGSFRENPALTGACDRAREGTGRLHLVGLVSDGGVHSQLRHLHALLDLARERDVPEVYVHAITDGRDTGPRTGEGFLEDLEATLEAKGVGTVATVLGRYYAMDRDRRWQRTKRAYDAMVHGEGRRAPDAVAAVTSSYADDITDEFLEPAVVEGVDGRVRDGDAVVTFNFRPDRMRQIVRALGEEGFDAFDRGEDPPRVHLATMNRYEAGFPYPVAFEAGDLSGTLGEIVAQAGLRQLRVAETEKYAHVTYFFSGGREDPFPGEERILIDSPRGYTNYDEIPEMSANATTDRVVAILEGEAEDVPHLTVMNFANPDMVGHSGDLQAAIQAVEAVDACLGRILAAAAAHPDLHLLITADHGNAEEMIDPQGEPQTAHTKQPVPLVYLGPRELDLRPGKLADVAPTVCALLGLEASVEMDGDVLF